jgi:hypothetical protein
MNERRLIHIGGTKLPIAMVGQKAILTDGVGSRLPRVLTNA